MEHLDRVTPIARRISAVNTVVREGDALVGSNTDWSGAVRALEREVDLAGARAVVLGAGGTARSLGHGLLERGALVRVLNRTPSHAPPIAESGAT